MLNKKIVSTELYKFAVNYSIKPNLVAKNGKDVWEYAEWLFEDLTSEGLTDNDFVEAIRKIKRENATMYNAMPNLAMFIEARPLRKSTLPEHQRIVFEKPKEIEKQLTPEQQKELEEKIAKNLAKLNNKVKQDTKQDEKRKKELLEWAASIKDKMNNPSYFGRPELYKRG